MAESPEHVFLSHTFIDVLNEFSSLGLYGITEADRKKYDFACTIHRDWARPLVGQTLWSHEKGIYKDISTMLTADDADIWAYVVRHNVKTQGLLQEVVGNFRQSRYCDQLFRLKILPVPDDFDADDEQSRAIVSAMLREKIAEDILFNVVFGNICNRDIRFFLDQIGSVQTRGLELALLHYTATSVFSGYDAACRALKVSTSTLRERVTRLNAIGFIDGITRYNVAYYASLKGRVFLDLLRRLWQELAAPSFSTELTFILRKLGLEPVSGLMHDREALNDILKEALCAEWSARSMFAQLLAHLCMAMTNFGVDLEEADYILPKDHAIYQQYSILQP